MKRHDVVIVGAGHGGAQVAAALRQAMYAGTIGLIGDDPELPYERPPLSKEYLCGARRFEQLLIRPSGYWQERGIDLDLGQRVVEVDPAARTARTEAGALIGYGTLVWAAGGTARRLACAGNDLAGVHTVRTRADVDRIQAELASVSRIAIVGAGFIGLEAAAAFTKLGKRVVVLEAMDRVLARVAGPAISHFFAAEHRAQGVDVRLGTSVAGLVGSAGRVSGVCLDGGEVLPADMVVAGIGIVPAVEPLLAAGAAGGDGVVVDALGRTTLPDVHAVGDCAMQANAYAAGAPVRLESVQNAVDQANAVACTIAGAPRPKPSVPWFWSNQYDLRLQTVGLSRGFDAAIVRGAPSSRSFAVVYLRAGRVIALDCVNNGRDFIQGKALITGHVAADPAALADPLIPLKSLAA